MRKILGLGSAIALATVTLGAGGAMATQPEEGATFPFESWSDYVLVDGHKVTYCHRTGSATNPYVVVTSDIKSVNDVDAMTTDHQHHVQVGNGLGPDIIPISEMVKKNVELVPLELCVEDDYPSDDNYS